MPKKSAGILLYRLRETAFEVLLVHPGGPLWKKKDEGSWSIPKGEFADEEPLAAAQREFFEETGSRISGPFFPLGTIRQSGGKMIFAWAAKGECDASKVVSNLFEMEWPPHSRKVQSFPEIDRASWFSLEGAEAKINRAQIEFISRLRAYVTEGITEI